MADNKEIDCGILEAVYFAALKHKDQRRKDPEKTPYINHPIGVAYILWKEGGVHDKDVLQVSCSILDRSARPENNGRGSCCPVMCRTSFAEPVVNKF